MEQPLLQLRGKPLPVRRTWIALGALLALSCLVSTSLAQPMLNEVQAELLEIEELTKDFSAFRSQVLVLLNDAATGGLTAARLAPVQDEAQRIRTMASSYLRRSADLSSGLYTPPGVELSTEVMYRVSASSLNRYFLAWILIAERVAAATPRSPFSTFDTSSTDPHLSDARIYRILANQQFQIDTIRERLNQGATDGD